MLLRADCVLQLIASWKSRGENPVLQLSGAELSQKPLENTCVQTVCGKHI